MACAEMRNFSSSACSVGNIFQHGEEKFRISARAWDILYLFFGQILDWWTWARVLIDFFNSAEIECVRMN